MNARVRKHIRMAVIEPEQPIQLNTAPIVASAVAALRERFPALEITYLSGESASLTDGTQNGMTVSVKRMEATWCFVYISRKASGQMTLTYSTQCGWGVRPGLNINDVFCCFGNGTPLP